jgi:hypothetical protein
MSQIYEYYEDGVAIEGVSANTRLSYTCKLCKSKGVVKVIKSGTTSNLIAHLQTVAHEKEYKIYLERESKIKDTQSQTPKRPTKRMLLEKQDESRSPLATCFANNIISSPKYTINSNKQRERYFYIHIQKSMILLFTLF